MVDAIALSATGFAYFSPLMRSTKHHHYVGKSSRSGIFMSTPDRCTTRRGILYGGVLVGTFLSSPSAVLAANLPPPTGADLKRTGSIDTLRPIVAIEFSLINAKLYLTKSNMAITPESCTTLLRLLTETIPRNEIMFKRIFDAYSTPVSYKQKFMDQNAFLVYYTKGYDGRGRPGLEEDDTNSIQTLQYGYRNDTWDGMENLFVELEFYSSKSKNDSDVTLNSKGELIDLFDKVLISLQAYLQLSPVADLDEARRLQ
jgi:hypothetical protein